MHEHPPQSAEVKNIFTKAREIAAVYDLTTAFPEHVFHALVMYESKFSTRLCGVAYRTLLRNTIKGSAGALRENQHKEDMPFSKEMPAILHDAGHMAMDLGDKEIEPEHLFVVLIKSSCQTVNEILNASKTISICDIDNQYRRYRTGTGRSPHTLSETQETSRKLLSFLDQI